MLHSFAQVEGVLHLLVQPVCDFIGDFSPQIGSFFSSAHDTGTGRRLDEVHDTCKRHFRGLLVHLCQSSSTIPTL
jgi:hypothetical protein